jgi:hypothetical protein
MSPAHDDLNLIFGLLAVQLDFIDNDALRAALAAWTHDKGKALGQILREQGALSA